SRRTQLGAARFGLTPVASACPGLTTSTGIPLLMAAPPKPTALSCLTFGYVRDAPVKFRCIAFVVQAWHETEHGRCHLKYFLCPLLAGSLLLVYNDLRVPWSSWLPLSPRIFQSRREKICLFTQSRCDWDFTPSLVDSSSPTLARPRTDSLPALAR